MRDEAGQRALTGESAQEAAERAFKPIWSDSAGGGTSTELKGQKVLEDMAQEAQVSRDFGQIAAETVANWSEKKGNIREHERKLLEQELDKKLLAVSNDPEQKARIQKRLDTRANEINLNQANYESWREGGSGRNFLHALAGSLNSGNISGAAGAYAASALAPNLNRLNNQIINVIGGGVIGAVIGWGY